MSVYININTISHDKKLKDLSIPSCLFINPNLPQKDHYLLNIIDNLVIDEKLYNKLLDPDRLIVKKYTKSSKKYNNKTKKKYKKK